ncbi:autotransporter outer membrane beta-barrel domain-containing protein [Anaerobiospirillum sp. NML120448]|uniref:autotransporter domain-containing protein n=1 Tax=Anaerobiospirillum sp. NML120448 TaxID=2932816 RepID=UPI001FF34516|nr:autotransporter outer membrane beta-barrel domain-containing protein [Anaerobiospirillum sp. NML120448]MCK0515402.1 autotransporter outer membrane beta-barrel domain-containing protein [Anaerobiospirillum sp. NML120448]
MKQTNNAIKFLMAQYRAIFQNAYFKGLATAAVVTMGLAAGQAQAASVYGDNQKSTELTVTIDGKATDEKNDLKTYAKLQVTNKSKAFQNQTIIIKDGAVGTDNFVKAAAAPAKLTVKNLELDATDATKGLKVSTEVASTNAELNVLENLTIKAGKLELAGKTTADAKAILNAKQISLNNKDAEKAVLSLGDSGSVVGNGVDVDAATGNIKKAATLISLDNNGTISFGGTAAADAVLNGQFVGDGEVSLDFSTASKSGTISAFGYINKAKLAIADKANAVISLEDNKQTVADEGTLTINEGDIELTDAGSVMTIDKGTVVLGDKVTLTSKGASSTAASIVIGNGTDEGALVVKKETADGFLGATKTGGIELKENGVLQFSDASVDLSGLEVVDTAATAKIAAADGAYVVGNNVTVSNALTGDGKANVYIQALDTLTLGNGSDATGVTFENKGFIAKNLELKQGYDEDAFTLVNDVELISTKDAGRSTDNKLIEAADSGLIKGSAIDIKGAGAGLSITAGNYETVGQNITLTQGTLSVESDDATTVDADGQDDSIASSLVIKGGEFKVIGAGTNAVTVSGAKASLDLSQTTLSSKAGGTAAHVGIVTQGGATLTIGQAQFESFAKKIGDNSGDKNAYFGIDGGTLKADSLTLNQGQLVSGANFDSPVAGINFKNTSSGTLEVAQTLTINKADTAVAVGENGFIQAGTLVLAPNTDNAATKLGTGNFTVLNALQTESEGGIETTEATSKVTFGKLEFVNGKNADDGHKAVVGSDALISGKLKVTNGAHNIAAGNWTAEQDLTIAAGTFKIGDAAKTDADGNIIKTSLTVEGKLDAAAGVTVAKESTLNANELNAGGPTAITVDGTANVAGKAGTESGATGLYGVALGGTGALTINEGGVLNFKGEALDGFYFEPDSNALLNEKVTAGSIVTAPGAQVNLNYTSGTTITVDQLTNLNKVFDDGTTVNGIVNLGEATLDGLKPVDNEITWDAAKKYENYLPGYTNNGLKEATLTGVATGTKVSGHFGSIKTDDTFASGSSVDVQKKGGLYNAKPLAGDDSGKKYFAVNSSGDSLGLNIADKTTEFTLGGEGIIDQVKFAGSGTLAIDKGFGDVAGNVTVSKTISGGANSVLNIKNGQLTVAGEKKNGVEIGVLKSEAGTSLNTKVLKITGASGSQSNVMGNVTVAADSGASTSIGAGGAIFGGKENKFAGSFAATGDVEFTNGGTSTITLTKDVADFKGDLGISGDAKVVVNGVLSMTKAPGATLKDQAFINVGEYDPANADKVNSSGFLQAQYISLGGNALAIDPAYGKNTSVVQVGAFTDTPNNPKTGVSTVKGDIYVLQNSALLVGMNANGELDVDSGRAFLASVQENGSLTDPEKGGKIGSLLYVNSQQKLAAGSSIVVDALANEGNVVDANDVLNTKYTDAKSFGTTTDTADLYLGKGSVIALGAGAHKDNGSIVFDFKDAAVFADQGGKIILDSDSYLKGDRNVVVFQDADNNGVNILGTAGTNDIRVETINGLMYFTLTAGQQSTGGTLTLDTAKADTAFSQASAPMKDFLVGYTALTKNWSEYYADGSTVERVELVGEQGPAAEKFTIVDGKITGFVNAADFAAEDKASNYVAIQTGTDAATNTPIYTVYHKANNLFLEKIVQNTQGAAADQAARMGEFGGAAETALVATSTTYDAVAGRFGMGQQAGTMTIANNGQGSGLWVTPVYKSHESDGFDADGLGYGSDITLYGVALGGDVTLSNGVRVGAMFNVGSGDADGQGAASVVSNDFDYFGGSIYAGYAIDNFSIVGDISYTTIDSDVEANTEVGKASTSFDTSALSVGVTGQYSLKVAEMDVTPHAGMRFTRIDMDDYTIDSADFGKVGQYNASSANVFSIPVGVTIAKEYVTDTWTVKPSFDLTLTGNFGDDTVDGTVSWAGVSNYDVSTKAEFVDSFTYGAAVGISAKTGNFGLGLGLNYTGSSNTDEFGVNANARYMF